MQYNHEVWKDIRGWEGIYQISNHGRIKSFKQNKSGVVLKLTNKNGDYFAFVLRKGDRQESRRIHRIVAQTFIPNPNNFPEVNHIDGNKQNNHVENLEWCTSKHNTSHAISMNPNIIKGMRDHNKYLRSKPVIQFDKQGNKIRWFISSEDAGRETGICARNILQVANKDPFNKKGQIRKTAGGYVWKFESEVIE